MRALEEAMAGEKPDRIRARIEGLDDVTHGWAGRRMDRAIAKAIEGKQVEDVETAVSSALGVDAHVASHGAGGQ
jgi:molecular chaperone HscA